MFRKLAILTLALVALGGALLVLRQQRLELANRNANLYRQIQSQRQSVWAAQAESALLTRQETLEHRLRRANLALEPADPTWAQDPRRGVAMGAESGTEVVR